METRTIPALIDELCSIPENEFTIPRVHDYLRGKHLDRESLAPYLVWRKDHYSRNLIFKNDRFEMIGFCWESGQSAPIHSHNRQLCWMSIQAGRLLVTNYRQIHCTVDINALEVGQVTPPGTVALTQTDQFTLSGAGVVAWADEREEIHSVVNSASFGERAISVHVYSRPFHTCITYDYGRQSVQRVALKYHSMFGELCSE